jgi:hypothetical protein
MPTNAHAQRVLPTAPNARASRVPTNAFAQRVLTNAHAQRVLTAPTHALRACQPTRLPNAHAQRVLTAPTHALRAFVQRVLTKRMPNAYLPSQRTRFARANQRVCPTRASHEPTNGHATRASNRPQRTRFARNPTCASHAPPMHALRASDASVSHPPMKVLNDVTNT